MKYLIIDDNPQMRKIIIQTVCFENDNFMECSDGLDAVNAYSEYLPDFVLMDIRMKNMNGLIATKNILQNFPDAKIIIITDYDTPTFRNAAIKAGALGFFSKENINNVKKYIDQIIQ